MVTCSLYIRQTKCVNCTEYAIGCEEGSIQDTLIMVTLLVNNEHDNRTLTTTNADIVLAVFWYLIIAIFVLTIFVVCLEDISK